MGDFKTSKLAWSWQFGQGTSTAPFGVGGWENFQAKFSPSRETGHELEGLAC